MHKRVHFILNVIMGSSVGVFIGTSVSRWLDYRENPELYAMQSAPWYGSIQIGAILLGFVLAVCLLVRFFLSRKK